MRTTTLALCAAAAIIVGQAAPAIAGGHTKIVTISIDGFCNVETITINRGISGNTIFETGDGCDENFGTGLYTKIKTSGKFANFSWSSASLPNTAVDMVFTKPFASDGTGQVSLLYTLDGTTQKTIGPYTYQVVTGDAKLNKSGLKSITSLVPRK